jgi:hypothetical protein
VSAHLFWAHRQNNHLWGDTSGASDPNYAVTYISGTLRVTPATLTITAGNASGTVGLPLPPFSMTYNGFVNGDSQGSLTSVPTLSTAATSSSPAGGYPIVAKGAISADYLMNYVDGVLTLVAAPVRVQAVSIQKARQGTSKKSTQVIVLHFSGALSPASAQSIGIYSLGTIASGKK